MSRRAKEGNIQFYENSFSPYYEWKLLVLVEVYEYLFKFVYE